MARQIETDLYSLLNQWIVSPPLTDQNRKLSRRDRVWWNATDQIGGVKLWNTDVLEYNVPQGEITLRHGGYMTDTTKSRLDALTRSLGLGGVTQRNYQWFVWDGAGKRHPFQDGMVIPLAQWTAGGHVRPTFRPPLVLSQFPCILNQGGQS